MERILVSSCLLGERVRYDGGACPCRHPVLERWLAEGRVVPFCPELAAGLPVPRPAAEIAPGCGGERVLAGQGRVLDRFGNDLTEAFLDGARRALAAARAGGARVAVFKEGSPSCGVTRIYDGTFGSVQVPGLGVTAALLRAGGLLVFGEDSLEQADAELRR